MESNNKVLNPKVSVIMGAYNCSDILSKSVASIQNQTFTNWELIICDDASTDDTYNCALSLASEDERIVVINNKSNKKLAYTLNKCLSIAKGEYIARMDADDISYPERLSKQVEFLESHPEYSVVGTWADVSDGNNIIEVRKTKEVPEIDDVLLGAPFIHPTIMMRKTTYDQLGGYTISTRTIRGQDRDLWFRFYAKGFRGYNLQESYFAYYERPGDYKKRSFKAALRSVRTSFYGYKLLKVPMWKYLWISKIMISYFIPQSFKRYYRKVKRGEKK